jgi:enamine deaminase RidA (YjgF/YER057c/UK114 family)
MTGARLARPEEGRPHHECVPPEWNPVPGADPESSLSSETAAVGGLVWTTQIPLLADGSMPDGIEEQTHAILANLETALARAGSGLTKVLHLTVYFRDLDDRAAFNEIYRSRFLPPRPVRCAIQVAPFGRRAMLLELTAVAARCPDHSAL